MATLSSPTLQHLISKVRMMLKQPDRTNSFWTDDELSEYINDAVSIYFCEVTQNNEGLFTTTANLNIVANTETVALPDDFFEVRTLWRKVNNGFIPLDYRNRSDEAYTTQGGQGDSFVPWYYLRQNNLVLRPTPNFSETAGLKIEYVQFPETMIYGGDQMTNQVSPIFKQLIEIYAVYKAKLVEGMVNGSNVHSNAEANLNAVYKTFKETIINRSKQPVFVKAFNVDVGGF